MVLVKIWLLWNIGILSTINFREESTLYNLTTLETVELFQSFSSVCLHYLENNIFYEKKLKHDFGFKSG